MPHKIAEADWKIYRKLYELALGRAYTRAMERCREICESDAGTPQDRYWDLDEAMKDFRKGTLRFDRQARSIAPEQLLWLISDGLITDDELTRFSPELQRWVKNAFRARR